MITQTSDYNAPNTSVAANPTSTSHPSHKPHQQQAYHSAHSEAPQPQGSHNASYAATEHGYVIGLISVKSELSYQQGIERHWKYLTRYDWMYPELTQLGEQAVNSYEIYADGTVSDFDVFGYQERFKNSEPNKAKSPASCGAPQSAHSTPGTWHKNSRVGQCSIKPSSKTPRQCRGYSQQEP